MNDKIAFLNLNFSEMIEYIENPEITEISVNDNREIWVVKKGLWTYTEKKLEKETILSLIRLVADYRDKIIDEQNPILETEFYDGSRFSATIEPISEPSFNLRKHSQIIFSLDDYVKQGNLTINQMTIIKNHIKNKKNILVVGATGSGKTTFANACINEIANIDDRVLIIEDTKEIICTAKNTLRLLSTKIFSTITIVKHCLRRTPERLIIGEIRGEEALYLLTAWNSGHGGGICTIHSENVKKGLQQLEQYILRISKSPQKELIADNVNIIVVITKTGNIRKITEIKELIGLDKNKEYILKNMGGE